MAALSTKLRSVAFSIDGSAGGIAFWCPGCGSAHAVCTHGDRAKRPVWTWDGNVDAPTISPSINIRTGPRPTVPVDRPDAGRIDVCHSFVRGGSIEFLGDCTHTLAGKTVPLPDWPTAGHEAGYLSGPPHD